jgi:hypothetical protein
MQRHEDDARAQASVDVRGRVDRASAGGHSDNIALRNTEASGVFRRDVEGFPTVER